MHKVNDYKDVRRTGIERGHLKTLTDISDRLSKPLISRRAFLAGLAAVFAIRNTDLEARASTLSNVPHSDLPLFLIGVLQPTTAAEISRCMVGLTGASLEYETDFDNTIGVSKDQNLVVIGTGSQATFALTGLGQAAIAPDLQELRDYLRMHLLHIRRKFRMGTSRESLLWPSADGSSACDTTAPAIGRRRDVAGTLSQDIDRPDSASRGTHPRLVSYPDEEAAQLAMDATVPASRPNSLQMDLPTLALCIGVSEGFLASIAERVDDQYRRFKLAKKSGGTRQITAPRKHVKTLQRCLAGMLDHRLAVHDSVHAFRQGRSFITNAAAHEGARYLLKTDITQFFDNVTADMLRDLFRRNGFQPAETDLLVRLCTYRGCLPQGAPTSPLLANAVLFDFDQHIHRLSRDRGLTYTRYSDDISVSGDNEAGLAALSDVITAELSERYDLKTNPRKRRLLLPHQQKSVTGVVINTECAPARATRNRIRAMFHNADRAPWAYRDRLSELNGYVSYLNAYPKYRGTAKLAEYRAICRRVAGMTKSALQG